MPFVIEQEVNPIVYQFQNITVYSRGELQVIVYGSGSDWVAQLASVTNRARPWRAWFATRAVAEKAACERVMLDTESQKFVIEDAIPVPQKFA